MPVLRVAVIDDDEDFLPVICEIVREAGGEPLAFTSADPALRAIERDEVDAVLTDLRLNGPEDGSAVVRACHDGRHLRVAVMSVLDSAEVALYLVRLGADDYFVKPSSALDLLPRVRTFLETAQIERTVAAMTGKGDAARMLAATPALKPLLADLPQASQSGANVLVLGESGSGKELAARAVHELSRRAAGPFVAVDCGAIPDSLLENELFGHRKGAYSDAREDRDGLVHRADGGTLFLDEIGELPLVMQAKLLRFMQTREYRRLGDAKVSVADVRFISATNRDLKAAVREGKFRQDLYYRIDVIELRIPPLRERREDIALLATSFLHRYAKEFERPALTLSRDAIEYLEGLPWEGNVRELENVMQRAVALAKSPVLRRVDFDRETEAETDSAPDDAVGVASDFHESKQRVIDAFEKDYASQLLRRHGGNLSSAAREAGIDRKSLSRLLVRHKLDVSSILAK